LGYLWTNKNKFTYYILEKGIDSKISQSK
jgi:hypothetical protein